MGGAICAQMLSMEIYNCMFVSNQATEGGAVAVESEENKPLNLLINAAKEHDGWSCTMKSRICKSGTFCAYFDSSLAGKCIESNASDPRSGFKLLPDEDCIRKWNYGNSSPLLIESSLFCKNTAKSVNSTVLAFGGALSAKNAHVTIHNTTIERNKVTGPLGSAGGGISLGPGTAFLTAKDTTLAGNRVEENASHSTLYTASAAQIRFDNVQMSDIEPGSALMLQSSGGISLRNDSNLTCTPGSNLQFDIRSTAHTFSDWQIDCSQAHVVNRTIKSYVNPTCEQLHGGQCINEPTIAPLMPLMNVSFGTIACVPCAPGLYSLDLSKKHENGIPSAVECHPCPYGANCMDGGAQLRVKSGFWGHKIVSHSENGRIGASQAEIMLCPTGYCCDHSSGCAWNTDDTCQGNRNQTQSLCGGCKQGFSQSIDGMNCVHDNECGGGSKSGIYVLKQISLW
jgi:hypothetical protein